MIRTMITAQHLNWRRSLRCLAAADREFLELRRWMQKRQAKRRRRDDKRKRTR